MCHAQGALPWILKRGWNGELWSKTYLLNWQKYENRFFLVLLQKNIFQFIKRDVLEFSQIKIFFYLLKFLVYDFFIVFSY